ncbi:MAG TPA: LysM peptidoglycan-binding domain-containing M23 family metallopeptidase [Caulobacteraceae bacterium]|nr:LysM peptidoglycan-binding domain-containing M23 family metallopeptidase [Caulobacteraceae bacterium]
MTNLWRGAAAVALLSGVAAGCVAPHYPISRNETPGPAPLSVPKPNYPISRDAAASPPVAAKSAEVAPPPQADPPPVAAPVAAVESQSLPPASAAPAEAPAASSVSAPTAAEAPPSASGDSSPPPASPPTASPPPPAAPPAASNAVSSDPTISPQMVVHDPSTGQSAPREQFARHDTAADAPPPAARRVADPHEIIAGDVVDAGGDIFENYQVQKGDHIDALARALTTSRKVILEANPKLRSPYLLHPGQILKVPVAKAYVAESGDTLSGVARRFSVEVGELAQLNHVSERAPLHEGQKIGLPSSMRDRGPLRVGYSSDYASSGGRYNTLAPPAHPGLTPLYGATVSGGSAGYAASPPPPPPVQAAPQLTDEEISSAAHGRFVWPVHGDIISRFGPMGVGRRNDGVDIKAAQGSEVKAAAQGEVVYAGDQVPGFGNLVLIKHADGWVTAYAHLDQVSVQMKDQVAQGQVLGSVGMTGGVTEPELHFEVRYAPTPADKARPVDPVLVLPNR